MKITPIHCGSYEFAQTASQYTDHSYVYLHFFGLEYMRIYAPDGTLRFALKQPEYPFLMVIPGPFRVDFSYRRQRKNWVVIGNFTDIGVDESTRELVIPAGESPLRIAQLQALSLNQAIELETVFARIGRLLQQQLPVNLFAAELLAASLLAAFSCDSAEYIASDPARRLKNAIDDDREFRRTLTELNEGSGFSLGHVRRLFAQQFQIDPGEYRSRCRLQRILDLLLRTDLPPKDIAARVGMCHVTYLHQFLRHAIQLTPQEIRRSYRCGDVPSKWV